MPDTNLCFFARSSQILAAILTKVYNLSDIYSYRYMLWYTREASVAVYVANFPGIWPLLRENMRCLRETSTLYGTQEEGDNNRKKKRFGYGSQQYYGELSSAGGGVKHNSLSLIHI